MASKAGPLHFSTAIAIIIIITIITIVIIAATALIQKSK